MEIKRLEDLPQFKILSIENDGIKYILTGLFNHFLGMENDRGWLYNIISWEDSIFIRHKEKDVLNGFATLIVENGFYNPILKPDLILPYVDDYWQPRDIAIAIDEKMVWNKIKFKATDAEYFKTGGVVGWQEVGKNIPDGAERLGIKKDGWDHEHCNYCNERISENEHKIGYNNKRNDWVCETCFSKYIKQHSIAFMFSG